jgi:hypothetical protein
MSLEKSFCSSPWLNARITNTGSYEFCRWQQKDPIRDLHNKNNIQNQSITDYFQKTMAPIRQHILTGDRLSDCQDCYDMEAQGKISGRQRQLLKVGIKESHFIKSLASSTLISDFEYSENNHGLTTRKIIDWQIDLGNYCNSACVFCSPHSSSRLASEFKTIGIIAETPPSAWCNDPILLEKFIKDLTSSTNTRYVHFIGGETLITPAFEKILLALIDAKLASKVAVGFTTNLTVWNNHIIELLKQFEQVNLGLSIETLTTVNDYVRWPSEHSEVKNILEKWIELGRDLNWLMQLRITPTCLTVHELDTVYEYAWKNQISIESCNFLDNPDFLRISVLPRQQRNVAVKKLNTWLNQWATTVTDQVINTRNSAFVYEQIMQDAQSYISYLTYADDESEKLPQLVKYLKQLEQNRGNKIIDYIPEYETIFRSAGY